MNLLEKIGLTMVGIIALFFISILFVVIPVQLVAESKCLAAGYPAAKVTISLDTYCVNLDGVVTNKVVKVEDLK